MSQPSTPTAKPSGWLTPHCGDRKRFIAQAGENRLRFIVLFSVSALIDIASSTRAPQPSREDHPGTLKALRVDGDHSFRQAPTGIGVLKIIFTKHSLRVVGKELEAKDIGLVNSQGYFPVLGN